jgi:hypothetical protein
MSKILMNNDQMLQCKLGLYKIYWTDGGSSLAAIGNSREGERWLAPTNWINTNKVLLKDWVKQIDIMELLYEA